MRLLHRFTGRRVRIVLLAGSAMASLLVGAACGEEDDGESNASGPSTSATTIAASAAPSDPVDLQFWHYFTDNRGAPTLREWAADLTKERPEYFESIQDRYLATSEVRSAIQAAVAAGAPPDVVVSSPACFYRDVMGAVSLEAFLKRDPQVVEDISPEILEFGQCEGEQIGIPFAVSSTMLFYNADLFKEAGLDPDNPPRTMDDLRKYAAAIKKETDKPGFAIIRGSSWGTYSFMTANGVEFMTPDGRAAFDSPAGLEAMKLVEAMAREDGSIPTGTRQEIDQSFLSGNLGMYVATSASINFFSEGAQFDLRGAPMPAFEGKDPKAPFGGSQLMILHPDPDHQTAAWEWIKTLLDPDHLSEWSQVTGYLPPKEGVTEQTDLGEWAQTNPLFQAALEMVPYSVPSPEWPGDNLVEIGQVMEEIWISVETGQRTAEEALAEAEKRVNELLP